MKKNLFKTILLSGIISLAFNLSSAQPGTLDPTFGTGGKVTHQINNLISYAYASAVQTNGKVLVAGGAKINNTTMQPCIARFNTDGTIDNTFGTNGQVQTPFGADTVVKISSIVIQTDGKIVGGGSYGPGVLFSYPQRDIFLIRYNTDGTLDQTFGNGGYTHMNVSIGIWGDEIASIVLQPDGKIVASGVVNAGNNPNYHYDFMTARFSTVGVLDNSFGTAGVVITDLGNDIEFPSAVVVQPDKKILVAGSYAAPTYAYVVLRYDSTGVLDNSFATNGSFNTGFGGNDKCNGMVLQNGGDIVLVGSATQGGADGLGMVRVTSVGALDNSFGIGGKYFHAINGNLSWANGVILQPDNKLVSCGSVTSNGGGSYDFALTRVNSNGTIDNTFGTNGDVTIDFAAADDRSYTVLMQPDLKIVITGTATTAAGVSNGIARVSSGLNVGVEDFSDQENQNIIYPNPASQFAVINSHLAANKKCEIKIFDVMGKEVESSIVLSSSASIDVRKFEDGIYFVQLNSTDKSEIQKLIVHH